MYVDEAVSFSDCEKTGICNSHHKYIITGNLRIIETKNLTKLLTKCSNYREPKSINFRKACFEIDQVLQTYIEKMSYKNKLGASKFAP